MLFALIDRGIPPSSGQKPEKNHGWRRARRTTQQEYKVLVINLCVEMEENSL